MNVTTCVRRVWHFRFTSQDPISYWEDGSGCLTHSMGLVWRTDVCAPEPGPTPMWLPRLNSTIAAWVAWALSMFVCQWLVNSASRELVRVIPRFATPLASQLTTELRQWTHSCTGRLLTGSIMGTMVEHARGWVLGGPPSEDGCQSAGPINSWPSSGQASLSQASSRPPSLAAPRSSPS